MFDSLLRTSQTDKNNSTMKKPHLVTRKRKIKTKFKNFLMVQNFETTIPKHKTLLMAQKVPKPAELETHSRNSKLRTF